MAAQLMQPRHAIEHRPRERESCLRSSERRRQSHRLTQSERMMWRRMYNCISVSQIRYATLRTLRIRYAYEPWLCMLRYVHYTCILRPCVTAVRRFAGPPIMIHRTTPTTSPANQHATRIHPIAAYTPTKSVKARPRCQSHLRAEIRNQKGLDEKAGA